MGTKGNAHMARKQADIDRARESNALLYGFFGKKAEPVSEVQKRLNQQLRSREVNSMAAEINEINATTN